MWKHLIHPNILPLLGITITPFQLISNWMPGGDLPEYLKKNPNANRLVLVSFHFACLFCPCSRYQLSDVAKGLRYLHSCNVTHGDLKGVRERSESLFTSMLTPGQPNILVDEFGHARIADFGLAAVAQNLDPTLAISSQRGQTVRWAAPEVLNGAPCTKQADIFSFAMVMFEVIG